MFRATLSIHRKKAANGRHCMSYEVTYYAKENGPNFADSLGTFDDLLSALAVTLDDGLGNASVHRHIVIESTYAGTEPLVYIIERV